MGRLARGREHRRAALILAFVALSFSPALASAAEPESVLETESAAETTMPTPRPQWRLGWPKFRASEVAFTGALVQGVAAGTLFTDAPARHWTASAYWSQT